MDVVIRDANIDDSFAINKISNAAFGRDYSSLKSKDNLDKILSNSNHKVLVAQLNNIVVGYVHASEYYQLYDDKLAYIVAIAVDETLRGNRIGKKLLDAIEDWAKNNNCAGMNLISGVERTDAHEFYYHNGYVLRKEHKNIVKIFK